MTKTIYLDNNATTAADPDVIEAINSILKLGPLNPSSVHSLGRKARSLLENARQEVADFLKVESKEILFASSGTECLNLLIRGLAKKATHIFSSNIEHSAIYNTLEDLKKNGHEIDFLSPSTYGALTPQEIIKAIKPHTKLIILSWVNGETGVKTDIPAIAKICQEKNILLIVDAVAIMGKELFTIPEGVSGMVFAAHKFHGPKGVGVAYINKNISLHSQITGGHQEHNLRAGTEDLAGIVALAKAISLLKKCLPEATYQMKDLRDYFEKSLNNKMKIEINGLGPRICNVSNICFHGIEAESLLFYLDRNNIMASHGSACSSSALKPSRILKNMGYSKERVLSSIRFSLSRQTTKNEIDQAVDNILQYNK